MSKEAEAALEAMEEKIEAQVSAVEESEWAHPEEDAPVELAPEKQEQSAKPVEESPAEAQEAPADEKVPAGDAAAPEAEGGTVEPEFDENLVAAAGLRDVAEAREIFGTPKALEAAVRLMDQRSVGIGQQAVTNYQEPPREESAEEEIPGDFQMPPPPEGEEWDEATVAIVKHLHQQMTSRLQRQQEEVKKANEVVQNLVAERQAEELRSYVNEFDGFVNQLGGEYEKTFGKGSGYDLNPQSVFLQNRVALDQTAKQLAFGRAQQGLPELPRKELLTRALRVAFPQQQESAIRKQVEQEVVARKDLIQKRPGGKSGRTQHKTGEEAAASYAEKWYAERGMSSFPVDNFDDSVI